MISSAWLGLLTALVPLLVGGAASRLVHASPIAARRLTALSALGALLGAGLTGLSVALDGGGARATAFLVLAPEGLGAPLSVYVDPLTAVMLAMVGVVGTAVSRFSVRYLDGDPEQARFSQWLAFTLGAVLLLIVSGNLVMLWLSWVASSLGLHKLLVFYADRPAARLAAKKKFVISRIGDALLLFGFLMVYLLCGSVEYTDIFAAAGALEGDEPWATLAGVFLVLGAMTKSAQLPVHSWLPDTMETPTPVSAFMHAGIINAGGFLLVRLSPFLVQAPRALELLAVVGATTAVFGSAVMLTQTDIKRKLAYSTVSQMGFMMLQIGLGAFSLAVLHIVGHSFYKAHAFASASSTVRTRSPDRPTAPVGRLAGLAALLLAGGAVFAATAGFDLAHAGPAGTLVLHGVLAIALAQMVLAGATVSASRWRGALEGALAGLAVAAAYFALGGVLHALLDGALATPPASASPLAPALLALFLGAFYLQLRLPSLARTPLGRRLYVHAYNGFYLGTLQDRFVARLWPDPMRTR